MRFKTNVSQITALCQFGLLTRSRHLNILNCSMDYLKYKLYKKRQPIDILLRLKCYGSNVIPRADTSNVTTHVAEVFKLQWSALLAML